MSVYRVVAYCDRGGAVIVPDVSVMPAEFLEYVVSARQARADGKYLIRHEHGYQWVTRHLLETIDRYSRMPVTVAHTFPEAQGMARRRCTAPRCPYAHYMHHVGPNCEPPEGAGGGVDVLPWNFSGDPRSHVTDD